MSDPTSPIVISSSAAPAQLASAMRGLLIALGGYVAGKGWLDSNIVTALVPVLMIIGPVFWAQVTAVLGHSKLVAVAQAAPDSVAQVQ